MVATVPGASRPFRPHSVFFNSQDSLSSNVNGQSRLANNVQIEGVDNNHRTGLLTVLIPSAEALETVAVTTSNYDAEFGRAGGAVTNVTIKSGTNQFKGSAFYFGNTESTVAINPFVERTLPKERQKPDSAYHQGGFTIGGPIVRNRLFFFGDYIRTSDDLGRVNRYTIPTMAMRNGDFSASAVPIFDPLTGDPATGAGRTQFPGNIIPADRISPTARRLLANVPGPNIARICAYVFCSPFCVHAHTRGAPSPHWASAAWKRFGRLPCRYVSGSFAFSSCSRPNACAISCDAVQHRVSWS
jgi:hypothetical protein